MAKPTEGLTEEVGVFPAGPYSAWANDVLGEVRKNGKRVGRVFKGESGWSDAVRAAGDRNAKLQEQIMSGSVFL